MANDIILPKKLHLTVSQICWIQVIYEYVSPGIRRCSLTCQAVHRPWLTPGGDDSIFMWCRAQLITSYECHWTPVAVWYIVPFKPIQSSYPFGKMHWFEMIYSPLLIIHTIFFGFLFVQVVSDYSHLCHLNISSIGFHIMTKHSQLYKLNFTAASSMYYQKLETVQPSQYYFCYNMGEMCMPHG